MSAGIRIYNDNRNLVIDGEYQNIALIEKINLTSPKSTSNTGGREQHIFEFEYLGDLPIVVLPIGIGYDLYALTSVRINNGKTVVEVRASSNKPFTVYLFGKPKQIDSTLPALRIYSHKTGELVFDSRQKYLRVLGECEEGKALPKNKLYGQLIRGRSLQWHQASFGSTSSSQYKYLDLIISHTYRLQDNADTYEIKKGGFAVMVHNSNGTIDYSIPLGSPTPPLLIDLTDF